MAGCGLRWFGGLVDKFGRGMGGVGGGEAGGGGRTPARVLFWTTSFQADVWSLAMYLGNQPDFQVMVAMEGAQSFLNEPIGMLDPPGFPLLERDAPGTIREIKRFAPDVVVVDNHFPRQRFAPALFVLWHGFGWKGPNDPPEFKGVYKAVKRLTNRSPSKRNHRFIWQCFGPTDLAHRNQVSGFALENLRSLGAAMTDDLITQRFDRDKLQGLLPESFAGRRVALLAFTWHYGSVFAHWGDDLVLFGKLFEELERQGYAIVVRMHDRYRYDPAYLDALQRAAEERGNVVFKFRNECRDNLLDLIMADLLISNYSSILNYFYATGRPSLHVYPVASENEEFIWRTWQGRKMQVKRVSSAKYIWKLAPEENGGLMARSFEELIDGVRTAASNPECCRERSTDFIAKHMAPTDGQVCTRIEAAIMELVESTRK